MKQSLGLVSLVVHNYEEALAFYVGKLGFDLVEDTPVPAQDKRWVVVRPQGQAGHVYCLHVPHRRNSAALWVTKPEAEFSCFSIRTTFGEISSGTRAPASSLSAILKTNLMER